MKASNVLLPAALFAAGSLAYPSFAKEVNADAPVYRSLDKNIKLAPVPDNLEKRQGIGQYIPADASNNWIRAPCPGTNTLANHGFISRQGVGITKQQYQQAFLDAFGFDFTVTQAGADNTFAQCQIITGRPCSTFNLDMLQRPHQIEHDGSLSRLDKEMIGNTNSDNQRFNQGIWDKTLTIFGANPHIGRIWAHTAIVRRYAQAQQADAPGWFSGGGIGGSNTEAAFYLAAFNDPTQNINLNTPNANPLARPDWINHFFENMELPTALGWHKPAQTVTGQQIASLANAVGSQPTASTPSGPSPFLRKRSLEEPEAPTASYNLVLDLERRSLIAPGSIPTNVSPAAIAVAKSSASAVAGAPPQLPNPYTQSLSVSDWLAVEQSVSNYVSRVQTAFSTILPTVVNGTTLF